MATRKKKEDDSNKTCFVIMPIADMDGYESGHFARVYEHVIKPSCIQAGFDPVRADDVAASNYIVIDILTKIVESDMVICDLSGRNPNVLYELGIRQSFNLPTVLIKDIKTNKIFDIQGLRYIEYNQALRVDSVASEVAEIAKSIQETYAASGKDVNSLVQLLGVKAATIPSQVELSGETSVILSAIKDLSSRMISLEQASKTTREYMPSRLPFSRQTKRKGPIQTLGKGLFLINDMKVSIGDSLYINEKEVGQLADVVDDKVLIKNESGELVILTIDSDSFYELSTIPF
ncbi:MAG: hypothetical protein AB2594_17855 [Candidatus Thiodiazotropha sp.]